MNDEERGTHYALLRIELEDVTEEQATSVFQQLHEHAIEIEGFEAMIISVDVEGRAP